MGCQCGICGWEKEITDNFLLWPKLMGASTVIYPVTRGGRPNNEVRGFICAKCLREANSMRVFIKSLFSNIQITKHAIDRYLERCVGSQVMDSETARLAMIKEFSQAKEIYFKEDYQVERLLNNKFIEAKYYFIMGHIYVTDTKTPPTILTVEPTFGKHLNQDFWYAD